MRGALCFTSIFFPFGFAFLFNFFPGVCFPWCRGRMECELMDVFVAQFKELLRGSYQGLPFVVMQFKRVNREGGS